jgi:ribonuclease D
MQYPVHYITETASLEKVVKNLMDKPAIAIDLEFDKNHYRYGFNLCLMQIFDGEDCYLIDPLAGLDIQVIFPLLENENIYKLCFAFNEDMRLLAHLGTTVKGVKDLAVARILTGKQALSLSNTLVDELNREAQVSQQKSNWFQRPLTDEQKHYAALDVVDLFELHTVLEQQLIAKGRLEWFKQEMLQFETANWVAAPFEVVPEKDRRDLTLREWMRFEKLMILRDEYSKALNRPAFKVIDKQIMKDIAVHPKNIEKWSTIKRIHPKYRNDKAKERINSILSDVESEIQSKAIKKDQFARISLSKEDKLMRNQQRNRLNQLKDLFFKPVKDELVEEVGEHLSNYILSNRKIQDLVFKKMVLLPYQRQIITKIATKEGLKLPEII